MKNEAKPQAAERTPGVGKINVSNTDHYYQLHRSEFHGGGEVSRHTTAKAARRAVTKYLRGGDCTCGCITVESVTRVGIGREPIYLSDDELRLREEYEDSTRAAIAKASGEGA